MESKIFRDSSATISSRPPTLETKGSFRAVKFAEDKKKSQTETSTTEGANSPMFADETFSTANLRSKLSVVAVLLCCALSFLPASSEAQSAQGSSASGTVQGKAPLKFFGELNRILQGNAESEQGSDSAGASSATSSSNQNGSTIGALGILPAGTPNPSGNPSGAPGILPAGTANPYGNPNGAPGILPAGATNPSGNNNGNPLILPAGGGSGTNNGGSPAILPAGGGSSGIISSSTSLTGTPTLISEQDACTLRCNGTMDGNECKCPASTNPTTGEQECTNGAVFVKDPNEVSRGGYCKLPNGRDGIGEIILCSEKGYTWDKTKNICVDTEGNRVDVYCDDGPGSVPKAIEDAMTIHGNFSVIQPHIDEIFQKGAGCFEGAINVYDLSPSIPTLGSIISSLGQALKKFLIQKICEVANTLREKITEPISKAISFIKNLDKAGDIVIANMTTSLFNSGFDKITNSLGWSGESKASSGYMTINGNALGIAQTVYNENKCQEENDPVAFVSNQDAQKQITERMGQISVEINNLRPNVERATNRYNNCIGNREYQARITIPPATSGDPCQAEFDAMNDLKGSLAALEQEQKALTDQIMNKNCVNESSYYQTANGALVNGNILQPNSNGTDENCVIPPGLEGICKVFGCPCQNGNVNEPTVHAGIVMDANLASLYESCVCSGDVWCNVDTTNNRVPEAGGQCIAASSIEDPFNPCKGIGTRVQMLAYRIVNGQHIKVCDREDTYNPYEHASAPQSAAATPNDGKLMPMPQNANKVVMQKKAQTSTAEQKSASKGSWLQQLGTLLGGK